MPKADKRGRSKGSGRFVMLTHFMMSTPAWRELTPAEKAVYVELKARYYGGNNGRIALSVRDAARLCKITKDTAAKCFRRLERLGFIELAREGSFSTKVRHASEWRLTDEKCDVTGAVPSRRYQRWRSVDEIEKSETRS